MNSVAGRVRKPVFPSPGELLKFGFDFLNTRQTDVMLLPIFPGYKGTADTILFVGGEESGDFLAQRLNSFSHYFWIYFHVLSIILRNITFTLAT